MAYSTISKPELHFNTKLYTGTGSSNAITGVGFQPDWVWIKSRTHTHNHFLHDAVRGVTKSIFSNLASAEDTNAQYLTAFGTDGFTVGTNGSINTNSHSYASWNWKASNSAGSSNSDGSQSSTVSVNTTAGFSIVKCVNTTSYTSNTFGHGLGVVPQMVIMRSLDDAYNWDVYHHKVGETKRLVLNSNAAEASTNFMNNTAPTNQVFTLKSNHYSNGSNAIAYCFAEIKGYSKFGNYTGNGNADGTFVYTGFKPAWLMIKRTNNTDNWYIKDNKRSGTAALQNFGQMNPNQTQHPSANNDSAENKASAFAVDILSNGFKCRGTDAGINGSSDTYIYMAFAEEPLVANVGESIPATAR